MWRLEDNGEESVLPFHTSPGPQSQVVGGERLHLLGHFTGPSFWSFLFMLMPCLSELTCFFVCLFVCLFFMDPFVHVKKPKKKNPKNI
jgi:sterol desaturase/sphingolipid hydroxylase (fatty acid hydroxylase superfamily)